jgi:hypothetical protein
LISIGINLKIIKTKGNIFSTEQLNTNSNAYNKVNDKVMKFIKGNGVFLLQSDSDNVTYLILDGSNMNSNNEAPYFSNVKIENNSNAIIINYDEELNDYTKSKYLEHRLIYKIIKDDDTEFMKVFKNGEETHFDSIILN